MVIGESMMADDVDVREESEADDDSIKEALAEIRQAQDEKPENTKQVSSEYFTRYKSMIAEMKA